jgi:hypothetical protein
MNKFQWLFVAGILAIALVSAILAWWLIRI